MKARKMFILTLALMLVTGLLSIAWAAEKAEHDTEALAKASQNPVANLITDPALLINISYGLPARKYMNKTFMTMTISKGLDEAIINPLDGRMMATIIRF